MVSQVTKLQKLTPGGFSPFEILSKFVDLQDPTLKETDPAAVKEIFRSLGGFLVGRVAPLEPKIWKMTHPGRVTCPCLGGGFTHLFIFIPTWGNARI